MRFMKLIKILPQVNNFFGCFVYSKNISHSIYCLKLFLLKYLIRVRNMLLYYYFFYVSVMSIFSWDGYLICYDTNLLSFSCCLYKKKKD